MVGVPLLPAQPLERLLSSKGRSVGLSACLPLLHFVRVIVSAPCALLSLSGFVAAACRPATVTVTRSFTYDQRVLARCGPLGRAKLPLLTPLDRADLPDFAP